MVGEGCLGLGAGWGHRSSPWLSSLFSCKNCDECQLFGMQLRPLWTWGPWGLCHRTGVHFQKGAISQWGN